MLTSARGILLVGHIHFTMPIGCLQTPTTTLQGNMPAFSLRPFSTNAIYKGHYTQTMHFLRATASTKLPSALFDPRKTQMDILIICKYKMRKLEANINKNMSIYCMKNKKTNMYTKKKRTKNIHVEWMQHNLKINAMYFRLDI